MIYWLYIVKCSDDSLYTGITKNIDNRIWQHNNSNLGAKSLRAKRPVILVYKEPQKSLSLALKREREIKGWNRMEKLKLLESRFR